MTRKIIYVLILVLMAGAAQAVAHDDPATYSSTYANFYYGVESIDIYREGLRQGNNPSAFSVVGDSNTRSPLFMIPLGNGGLNLDEHEYMRGVFEYFSSPFNSFTNRSVAAQNGWTTVELLTPGTKSDAPNARRCQVDETPLQCEYRITRPSLAFIMIGTNDIMRDHPDEGFRGNLNAIVDVTRSYGVIPILSTIPDIRVGDQRYRERVAKINEIIISVAYNHQIPVWDLWADLQALPNRGLTGDGLHLSAPASGATGVFSAAMLTQYGFNLRNFRLLSVLDQMNLHLRPE